MKTRYASAEIKHYAIHIFTIRDIYSFNLCLLHIYLKTIKMAPANLLSCYIWCVYYHSNVPNIPIDRLINENDFNFQISSAFYFNLYIVLFLPMTHNTNLIPVSFCVMSTRISVCPHLLCMLVFTQLIYFVVEPNWLISHEMYTSTSSWCHLFSSVALFAKIFSFRLWW